MREQLLRSEIQQRRNNALVDGFVEQKEETANDCLAKVRQILSSIGLETDKVQISQCHRLGKFVKSKTRSVLVSFQWYGDKETLFKNKMSLPDNVFVNDDYPEDIKRRRQKLYYQSSKQPVPRSPIRITPD